MGNKIWFLSSSRDNQLSYSINRMHDYVHAEEYEHAAHLRDCIVRFQDKDFNLDNISDYKAYIKMLNILF